MNEQEKQALIDHAKENVKALKMASRQSAFKEVKGSIETDLKLAEIALAALTAEPIYQLINDGNWYDAEKHIYDEAVERGDVARIVFRSATPAVNTPIVPAGWKLTPEIACPSQWAAGQKAFEQSGINKIDPVYKAMVNAAPPAPAVNLADLVPGEMTKSLASIANEYQTSPQNAVFIVVGWNACRAEILRRIEKLNEGKS